MNSEKATAVLQDFCRFFRACRQRCDDAVTGNPAIYALCAVLLLLVAFYCAGAGLWIAGAAVFLAACLCVPVKTALCCILPALAAVMLSISLKNNEPVSCLEETLINRRTYGEFEVRITDRTADPAGPAAKMVRAEILKYRLAGETEWIELAEPVPTGLNSLDLSPGYGDRLLLHAFLYEPDPPLLPETFSYRDYLRREGITFLLRRDKDVETVLQSRGSGVSRFFYDLRSTALARMTSGMETDEARALTSGIFFGISRDLDPETKQDFLRSGTVHILTVSGTHVGFFALLIFCLCPFLSFRGRAVCVILFSACYVWLTGMNEPSLRALLMITCFLTVKAFRLRTKSLNTLALAALILLAIEPENLFSTGFQFSFLIVTVLLMSAPLLKEIRYTLYPDHLLVPASRTPQFVFFLREQGRKIAGAVLGSIIAALAGVALAAYYQGLFSGSSVLANLLLLPVIGLAFPVAALAIVFGGFCSGLLEKLLQLVLALNESLAETGVLTFAKPPLWSVILMIALILLLFLPKKGFWKIPVACGILAIPLWWHFRTITAEPELLILHGADRNMVFVLTEPDRRSAIVVNMPDYASAADVSAFLKSRGISRCRIFAAADHYVGSVAGLDFFADRIDLYETHLFSRQNRKCKGMYPIRERKDAFFLEKDLKIASERGNFNAVFTEYGIDLQVIHCKNGTIRLTVNGKEQFLLPSLKRSYQLYCVDADGVEQSETTEQKICPEKK